MENLLNETTFEEHIAKCLANSDLYNQRSSAQFDTQVSEVKGCYTTQLQPAD